MGTYGVSCVIKLLCLGGDCLGEEWWMVANKLLLNNPCSCWRTRVALACAWHTQPHLQHFCPCCSGCSQECCGKQQIMLRTSACCKTPQQGKTSSEWLWQISAKSEALLFIICFKPSKGFNLLTLQKGFKQHFLLNLTLLVNLFFHRESWAHPNLKIATSGRD